MNTDNDRVGGRVRIRDSLVPRCVWMCHVSACGAGRRVAAMPSPAGEVKNANE